MNHQWIRPGWSEIIARKDLEALCGYCRYGAQYTGVLISL